MNWNPADFISEHLQTIIIVGSVVGALIVALIVFLIVRSVRRSNKISRYVKDFLLKADFNYELCSKESDQFHDFIKIGYKCLDYHLAFYFYVQKSDDYLALAKKEVKHLIKDNTLLNYTLDIIPKREFEGYAY